jgi:hypothetical protein
MVRVGVNVGRCTHPNQPIGCLNEAVCPPHYLVGIERNDLPVVPAES